MVSVYEKCPEYESKNYFLQFVDAADAPDLLQVYSDEKAVPRSEEHTSELQSR